MEITEVRIKLMENTDDRLRAFCSITFDHCFAVRDLKIIDGTSGPFVAMPSRKLTTHCHRCGYKNHIKAQFCNQCGERQREDRPARDSEGRAKLYADIAHPINTSCREMIQERVIAEFLTELERAKQPGYASRYDDDYDFEDLDPHLPGSGLPIATSGGDAPFSESTVAASPKGSAVPPPHIPTAPAANETNVGELSGPHFDRNRSPGSQPAEEVPQEKDRRGDFGAGILD